MVKIAFLCGMLFIIGTCYAKKLSKIQLSDVGIIDQRKKKVMSALLLENINILLEACVENYHRIQRSGSILFGNHIFEPRS